MEFVKAIFLAVVEGVTEFLPISSTGHLILLKDFVRFEQREDFVAAFMVIIQLPAILAVVVYFWSRLWPLGKPPEERDKVLMLWTKIGVAFLPAAVLGFLLDDFIEARLFDLVVVALALLIGGVVLLLLERGGREARFEHVGDASYGCALAVGFFQCLAMIPGTSRSAATIIGGMALGASRAAAAEFSFFLAIPTMLGATTLKLLKGGAAFTGGQWGLLAVGSVVSFAVAYAVAAFLMNYVRRHDFKLFGYYRIALALVVLAYFFFLSFDPKNL
ncbi:MAG: undecaprenyl-diphosphate phosphatase [Candidatus Hydrogenedentes bacterium]|nr:undecaprenyl-diphosphate phosphatase [Candidatus Hydrogenedentota bacterium]